MNVSVLPRHALSAARREAMRALLVRHFDGVSELDFTRDLEDKQWIVLLEDADGQLHGFTTLRGYVSHAGGRPVRVVCSGDTIVDPRARRGQLLARGWLEAVLRHAAGGDDLPLYWLLICSGYRTYRFLPVFFREYWPRFDRDTPVDLLATLRALATERWNDRFLPAAGIVRLARPQLLRGVDARVPAGRKRDPHVAFFLRANPGHARGDELVCVAPIAPENLTPAGRRVLAATATRRSAVG